MRVGLAVLAFLATDALAAPGRLLRAKFKAYTIAVSGEGLTQPNPTVNYNIKLTQPSGESMAIVDLFPVTPEKDGRFHKAIAGTWKTFEFTLTDKYTLSGSALLTSDLNLLHTIRLEFSPKNLNCAAHAARAPVLEGLPVTMARP